jgi:hypothetical protein
VVRWERGDTEPVPCRALGDEDQARRHWQEALAIFTELGVPEAGEVRARLTVTRDPTA